MDNRLDVYVCSSKGTCGVSHAADNSVFGGSLRNRGSPVDPHALPGDRPSQPSSPRVFARYIETQSSCEAASCYWQLVAGNKQANKQTNKQTNTQTIPRNSRREQHRRVLAPSERGRRWASARTLLVDQAPSSAQPAQLAAIHPSHIAHRTLCAHRKLAVGRQLCMYGYVLCVRANEGDGSPRRVGPGHSHSVSDALHPRSPTLPEEHACVRRRRCCWPPSAPAGLPSPRSAPPPPLLVRVDRQGSSLRQNGPLRPAVSFAMARRHDGTRARGHDGKAAFPLQGEQGSSMSAPSVLFAVCMSWLVPAPSNTSPSWTQRTTTLCCSQATACALAPPLSSAISQGSVAPASWAWSSSSTQEPLAV